MSRPLRIEFEGATYHITSRGNAKQFIFLDNNDKEEFLEVLYLVVERFNWLCHTYCLMDNHYHLIIETPEGNLSRGMRWLNGVYTQKFNLKHKRVGHLFQGRYKSILVDKDSYLLTLSRYVVLNPVRAGLVKRPEDWQWSSYRSTIGKDKRLPFLTIEWILSQFGDNKIEAISRYNEYILNGIDKNFPWQDLRGQIILGSDSFIEKIGKFLKEKEILKEVPRKQRYSIRPRLDELFTEEGLKDKTSKDETIYNAYVLYGYTMNNISEYLNVHYATISRAVKRAEKRKK